MNFKRHSMAAVVAAVTAALVLVGCGTVAKEKKTVVVVETTAAPAASASPTTPSSQPAASNNPVTSPGTGASAPVAAGTLSPSGTAPAPVASPPAPAAEPAAPVVKVDPLKAVCGDLFSVSDTKKIFGGDISAANKRVLEAANPKVNSTGKLRCQLGVEGKSAAVAIGLTQYSDAASATKQLGVTVAKEKKDGAKEVVTKVNGYPATVLLRDGGMITVVYDTWTLAIAINSKLAGNNADQTLVSAAELVMNRVVKRAG